MNEKQPANASTVLDRIEGKLREIQQGLKKGPMKIGMILHSSVISVFILTTFVGGITNATTSEKTRVLSARLDSLRTLERVKREDLKALATMIRRAEAAFEKSRLSDLKDATVVSQLRMTTPLRATPSGDRIGMVSHKTPVTVLGKRGSSWRIIHESQVGFVTSEAISLDETTEKMLVNREDDWIRKQQGGQESKPINKNRKSSFLDAPYFKCKRALRENRISLGMNSDEILAICGRPKEINRSVGAWGTNEQWVYRFQSEAIYLYMESSVLTSWQD